MSKVSIPPLFRESGKTSVLLQIIRCLFLSLILLTLADLCIKDTPPDYVYGTINSSTISNFVFVVLALLAGALLMLFYLFARKRFRVVRRSAQFILFMGFAALLVAQVILAKHIYFLSDWDIGMVETAALEIANNGIQKLFTGYFLMYPNNILLTLLLSGTMKASLLIGLDPYFGCILLNILLVDLAGLLSARCILQITKSPLAMLGCFFLFAVFIGLSAWIVIPYSDTIPMFMPILAFSLYLGTRNGTHLFLKWSAIIAVSIFGTFIKPTCAIALIAILIMHLVRILQEKTLHPFRATLMPFSLLLAAFIMIVGTYRAAVSVVGKSIDPDRSMPYTHFLMMGLNPITYGTFAPADAEITLSAKTKAEREQKNWHMISIRLRNYGFIGYLDFLSNKHLVNYNDGTFAWGREGVFYAQLLPEQNEVSSALREIYYSSGSHHAYYANIMQGIWVFVLVSLLGLPLCYRSGDLLEIACIMLTIMGITLFLSLFESRARYLLCNVPFFLVGAVLGIQGATLTLAQAIDCAQRRTSK